MVVLNEFLFCSLMIEVMLLQNNGPACAFLSRRRVFTSGGNSVTFAKFEFQQIPKIPFSQINKTIKAFL